MKALGMIETFFLQITEGMDPDVEANATTLASVEPILWKTMLYDYLALMLLRLWQPYWKLGCLFKVSVSPCMSGGASGCVVFLFRRWQCRRQGYLPSLKKNINTKHKHMLTSFRKNVCSILILGKEDFSFIFLLRWQFLIEIQIYRRFKAFLMVPSQSQSANTRTFLTPNMAGGL